MKTRTCVLAALLLVTVGARQALSKVVPPPPRQQFAAFPAQLGQWHSVGDVPIEGDVAAILSADDYLERTYRAADGTSLDLFAAYYNTQRAGESMHSPRNCLPGSGWIPIWTGHVRVPGAGDRGGAEANVYIVDKNGEKAMVVYWYQAQGRVIANEYLGKLYLVLDTIRTHRRDGAIIRFVAPLHDMSDRDRALASVLDLAAQSSRELPKFVPN